MMMNLMSSTHPDENRDPSPTVTTVRSVWVMDPVFQRGEWRMYNA